MTEPLGNYTISGPGRFLARLISFLFHPLLVGILMTAYLIYVHPAYFLAVSKQGKLFKLLTFANNTFVFPFLIVLLLRGLGFTQSIYLHTQRERIIPYVASMVFFFWTWYVFRNQADTPRVLTDMCQGIFISSCLALILNNFFKISMHAIGMGGLLGLMLVVLYSGQAFSAWPVMVAVLLAGLVCSARLAVSDHQPGDILAGLLVGMGCQLFAWWV
jgi:hypothetical protein